MHIHIADDARFIHNENGTLAVAFRTELTNGLAAIPTGSCTAAVDQRGVDRPQDGGSGLAYCDIGAYEIGACPAPVTPTLTIAGVGSHILLSWDEHTENREVEIWRGADPFDSGTFSNIGTKLTANTAYLDHSAIGDPGTNYFYAVLGQNACGETSTYSNRVGELDFRLDEEGATHVFTGTGVLRFLHFAVVSLPLEGANLPTTADGVAGYVDPGGSVRGVAKWNPKTRSWIVRRVGSPFGTPDFAVSPGDVLLLGMTPYSPETFAWVGDVPAAGNIANTLHTNTGNSIMIPLDQHYNFTMNADGLAADIGGVTHVARWNRLTQSWILRTVGVSGPNFPVHLGYPYAVITDNTAPPFWP